MNIETLKVFRDLMDTQSFTKAAKMNYISQSAVSQQVKKLELVFKSKLFIKKENKLELTEIGKVVYNASVEITKIFDETIGKINCIFDGTTNAEIKIASTYSVGIYLLSDYIRNFISKYKCLKIKLDYFEWDDVIKSVINNDYDFGFVSCFKVKDINITSLYVTEEEMVLVAPPNFKCDKKEINFKDLSNLNLIFFEKNTPSRKYIERFIKNKGSDINITMELNNIETIKAAISSGVGFSILPYNAVYDDLEKKRIKVIKFQEPFSRPVYMIYNKRRKFARELQLFINFILSIKNKKLKLEGSCI